MSQWMPQCEQIWTQFISFFIGDNFSSLERCHFQSRHFSYPCSVSLKAVQVWCCNLSNIAPTQWHITAMIFTAISCNLICMCMYTVKLVINLINSPHSGLALLLYIFLRYCNSNVLINLTHQLSCILNKSSNYTSILTNSHVIIIW